MVHTSSYNCTQYFKCEAPVVLYHDYPDVYIFNPVSRILRFFLPSLTHFLTHTQLESQRAYHILDILCSPRWPLYLA